MNEREIPREDIVEAERVRRDSVDIGTGLGGGLAPVLPTDLDAPDDIANPLTDKAPATGEMAPAKESTVLAHVDAEPLPTDLPRFQEELPPLALSRETQIITTFGDHIGEIKGVYGYAPSNDPRWASVEAGGRNVLVPLMSGMMEDDGLHVPYPKELIESAPEAPSNGDLSIDQEMVFYTHYNERRILPTGDAYTEERRLHLVSSAA